MGESVEEELNFKRTIDDALKDRERKRKMAKQSTHHTSPTTVVVSTTAGASAAAASLSTSATTAVTASSSSRHMVIGPSNGQSMNQIEPSVLDASTFAEVPVNGNIDSLISSSSSCIQVGH